MENLFGTVEIKTDRLLLGKFHITDSESVYEHLICDDKFAVLISDHEWTSSTSVRLFINELQQKYISSHFFFWAIRVIGNEDVIGFIRADYNRNVNSVSLTFALGAEWQNRGYMKESISAVITYLIETVGVNRIEALFSGHPIAARKVLIRCGFFVEGVLRQSVFNNGKIDDLISYSVMKDTYLRIKKYQKLTIDDLWITNYREKGGEHMKSIMRLPENEAIKFAGRLSSVTTSGNDRYGSYFTRYYERRQKTEKWLYEQFCKHGGVPLTNHPIYFVLCDSQSLESFFGQKDKMYIKLRDIPSEYISFTPRDSMHLKDMGLLEGTVWTKNDLFDLLMNRNNSIGETIVNLPGLYGQQGGYIEAHLWNDDYLKYAYKDE